MEQPEIRGPLKWNSRTYGSIVVKPDGSFTGQIDDPEIHANLVELTSTGMADGLLLTFHPVPAVPLREHKMESIPETVTVPQMAIYSRIMADTQKLVDEALNGPKHVHFDGDVQNPDWDGN